MHLPEPRAAFSEAVRAGGARIARRVDVTVAVQAAACRHIDTQCTALMVAC